MASLTTTDPLIGQIAQALPHYLTSRRWYRGKARNMASLQVEDIVTVDGFPILLARVDYDAGEPDSYVVPTTSSAHQGDFEEVITTLETADGAVVTVYSALAERGFRDVLFKALACGASYPGLHGDLVAEPSPYFLEQCQRSVTPPDSFVSRAEQSNTSIVYGKQYILKLFRKLESGINPDIEIGRYLTAHKFANSPAVLGVMEYRASNGISHAAAILQEFVANQGDAWKYTLECLGDFFMKALMPTNTLAPVLPSANPHQLMKATTPLGIAAMLEPYLTSAALLGRRTAEMHAALASSEDRDFKPEPFDEEDADRLKSEMVERARWTLQLLRQKQDSLDAHDAVAAAKVLSLEPAILGRFTSLTSATVTAMRIRHHGDYHLGQVLYTGSDFVIIDFEGEPARPLAERRAKTLALKDVAGMVRSFQYAAYAALFGMVPGVMVDAAALPKLQAWAAVWNGWVSAAYLNAYFAHSQGQVFAPSSELERQTSLDAFLLQKALYEVEYELNNRPAWVGIPLRGILSLME